MSFNFDSVEIQSLEEELNDELSAVFSGDWFIKEEKLTPDMPFKFLFREKVIRKIFGVEPNQEWKKPVENSSTDYALLTDSRYIIFVTMIGNGFGDEFQDLSDDHTGLLFNAPVVVFTLNHSEKDTFTMNINDENNTYAFQGVGRFKTIENGKVILEKLWDVCYLPKHQI